MYRAELIITERNTSRDKVQKDANIHLLSKELEDATKAFIKKMDELERLLPLIEE